MRAGLMRFTYFTLSRRLAVGILPTFRKILQPPYLGSKHIESVSFCVYMFVFRKDCRQEANVDSGEEKL
jgi:hypothetical protein